MYILWKRIVLTHLKYTSTIPTECFVDSISTLLFRREPEGFHCGKTPLFPSLPFGPQ